MMMMEKESKRQGRKEEYYSLTVSSLLNVIQNLRFFSPCVECVGMSAVR